MRTNSKRLTHKAFHAIICLPEESMSGTYMCEIQFFAKQGLCDDDEAVGTRHIVKLNFGEKEATVILRRYLFNGKKSEHSTF